MLKVEGLHVKYGSIVALRGVSLEVAGGEAVSVVGPNGAGKSTLMHAITGVTPITSGTITLDGLEISGRRVEQIVGMGVALVPENREIFATLTVEENLLVGARGIQGAAARHAEIDRVLGFFPAVRERLGQPAGRLSGGEQQQLAIGRALLGSPRLLLLDEPSLGLAPKVIDLLYGILEDLRSAGITLLLVEQNATRALGATDRTYVLRTGQIELTGSAAELAGAPQFEEAYFGFGEADEPS